LKTPQIE